MPENLWNITYAIHWYSTLKFLFLESFFGGSHREFAEGLAENSRHEIEILPLPARFWKWRMRGAALWFVKEIKNLKSYDGLITTNMMSLSDFKSLSGPACPPVLLYFHENQFAYPLAPGERMDYQYGFTDITTALAADRVVFNSRFHYETFFSSLPVFLNRMPEFRPAWVIEAIRSKSGVLYPGCRFSPLTDDEFSEAAEEKPGPPMIIWNHRWEFDKAPEVFFQALDTVADKGADFRLALLGENFRRVPDVFRSAKKRYQNQIVHYGYVKSRKEYIHILCQGDIVISTAIQENFGISVAEAIRCGCLPLLPDRLSYPEILPREFHADFLCKNTDDLTEKLFGMLADFPKFRKMRTHTAAAMERFAWKNMISAYDDLLEEMVQDQ